MLFLLQGPDRVPFRAGRLGGQLPRTLAEDCGGFVSPGRPAETLLRKVKFAGAPVRESLGVIGDKRRLRIRKVGRQGRQFVDPERLGASLDADGVKLTPGERVAG